MLGEYSQWKEQLHSWAGAGCVFIETNLTSWLLMRGKFKMSGKPSDHTIQGLKW